MNQSPPLPREAGERPPRTIFVGDIHGCCAEFETLLSRPSGSRRTTTALLLTGDAFTRGPDPVGVWQAIRATATQSTR